mgnify:CR=1 FL=1
MTKKEAIKEFKKYILPGVVKKYGNNDLPAKREAWNNYTDHLHEEGRISQKQYENWTNIF